MSDDFYPFVARIWDRTLDLWWPRLEHHKDLDGYRRETSFLSVTLTNAYGHPRYPHLTIRGQRSEASWTIRADENIGNGMLLLLREVMDSAAKHGQTHGDKRGHLIVRHIADPLALLADQIWMRYNSRAGALRNKLNEQEVFSAVALLRAACYPMPADMNPVLARYYSPMKDARPAHVAMLPIGPFSVQRLGEDGPNDHGRQALLSINGQHCVIREVANEFERAMIEVLARGYGARRDKLQDFWWLAAEYADKREEDGDLEQPYLDILRSGVRPLSWHYGIPNHADRTDHTEPEETEP